MALAHFCCLHLLTYSPDLGSALALPYSRICTGRLSTLKPTVFIRLILVVCLPFVGAHEELLMLGAKLLRGTSNEIDKTG